MNAETIIAQYLGYLWSRWQDEMDYEDFKDYVKAAEKQTGMPIKRMTKRPFEAVFEIGADVIFFRVSRGGRIVSYGKVHVR